MLKWLLHLMSSEQLKYFLLYVAEGLAKESDNELDDKFVKALKIVLLPNKFPDLHVVSPEIVDKTKEK